MLVSLYFYLIIFLSIFLGHFMQTIGTLFADGKWGRCMRKELLDRLRKITPEEEQYLSGSDTIRTEFYTEEVGNSFIIDCSKLLDKGRLIELRPHTRFVHFPKHSHNYVELVYMCSGSTTHILNGNETLVLKEGDLLFLNQNATQEILPAGEEDIAVNFVILPEFFNVSFSMMQEENVLRDFLLSTLSGGDSLLSFLHFSAKDILPVQNLLENMIWTIYDKHPATNTIVQTTMGLLLMNLSAFAENINKGLPERYDENMIFKVLKYIETGYKTGTLAEISAEINEPAYFVSRLLKKHLNKNFKELLQERKLQQAVFLLKQSTLTVEKIIASVGYDNSSYFHRKFREKYGMSPGEYRKTMV